MTDDEMEYAAMGRALRLARNGPRGINPQVGAVILSSDAQVLAEGWHRGVGTPHAEVDALSKLAPGAAAGATAVVTLEPCDHTGNTGPCTRALIAAGVARVVYAVDDPGLQSGGGADRLRAAGVEVEAGVREAEARELLDGWLTVQRLDRPHVTIKWAQSLDGRAAAADGTSRWITGPEARADVHRRRAESDAIVVGIGTVIKDDPALTARAADGSLLPHQPVPVVLGVRPVPETAAVQRHPHRFLQYGGDLTAALEDLRRRGVQRIFVEGGPTVASSFLREGLADRIIAYVAPVLLGGARLAVTEIGVDTIEAARRLEVESVEVLGDDLLLVATPRDVSPPSPVRSASREGSA